MCWYPVTITCDLYYSNESRNDGISEGLAEMIYYIFIIYTWMFVNLTLNSSLRYGQFAMYLEDYIFMIHDPKYDLEIL